MDDFTLSIMWKIKLGDTILANNLWYQWITAIPMNEYSWKEYFTEINPSSQLR